MTTAGVMAKKFTSELLESANQISIELDFPRDVGLEDAIALSRDRYGRLITHIYIDGMHLNHELIRLGYSPYFNKYGNSRLYDSQFRQTQAQAINNSQIIWNLETNQGGYFRDYESLLPWWERRAAVVDFARFCSVNPDSIVWNCDNQCSLITRFKGQAQPISALVDFQNPLQLYKKGSALKVRSAKDLIRVFIPTDVLRENFRIIERLRLSKNYGIVRGFVGQYRGIYQLLVIEILQT